MRLMVALLALGVVALPVGAQSKVSLSGGDVLPARVGDLRRLTRHIMAVAPSLRERVRVTGDSAQRVAMHDFEWMGRVLSVELDEDEARLYWDVKIVPDSAHTTVMRYRVDAGTAGIIGVREFRGVVGLVPRPASSSRRP